jgi:hypothetical protein
MAELGYQEVKLPSRGALYDGKIPDGVVQVRKLGASEESQLLSSGAQGLERIDAVLKNCVKLPNDYKHEDLLMTDRMALMLAMRTLTFGPQYTFDFKCRFCNTMQRTNPPVNILEDLEETTPDTMQLKKIEKGIKDWMLREPFEVELEDEGTVVALRLLRGKDENRVVKRANRMMMQSVDGSDPSYLFRFAVQIVSIGGEDKDIGHRELFVRKLSATDLARLRIATEENEPGIDLRVYPTCRGCGAANEMMLPFTAEFFRPTQL